jgi:hypothetical protein
VVTVKQPEERREKFILVSMYARGRRVWGLVAAIKVGNSYRISNESWRELWNRMGFAPTDQVMTITY